MNINNNVYNILGSNIAPNPIDVKYWADFSANPYGGVLKYFNGTEWTPVNGSTSGEIEKIAEDVKKLDTEVKGKVDKVTGKQLSTNDYTTEEKTKLAGIAANANNTTVENVLTSDSTTNALSAAQGKALKTLIDSLTARVTALETPVP